MTLAPSDPRRLAIPCPIPEPAPVTMATFPSKRGIFPPHRCFVAPQFIWMLSRSKYCYGRFPPRFVIVTEKPRSANLVGCEGARTIPMPIQKTSKIWHNGNLIPWEQANIHVMSHVIHYGSSVFEGIRCYAQPQGSAVFRLPEHMQRLLDSAKIYRMELPFTLDELCAAVVDLIEANGVAPCYIRPIVLRGYGEIGVNP